MNPKVDTQNEAFAGNRLLKMQEVAHYLNVSRSFAYLLVQTGQLTAVRLGKGVRVRPQDLRAFIEQNINRQGNSI